MSMLQCCVCLLLGVRRDADTQIRGYSVCGQHIDQATDEAIDALKQAANRRQQAWMTHYND